MWIGWSSQVTVDNLPRQTIGYMDNYSLPPTRLDVVAKTMKTSQKVAAECGEAYAIVHYDLAVAKLALQIQAEETPVYDNVFVCFGAFHVQMAYFAAIGTYLADSGEPQVLTDVGVLASGSLNGFLSGRHYNRCKRIHVLLSLALQMLHFKRFKSELITLHDEPSPAALDEIESSEAYSEIMQKYNEFLKTSRSGYHRSTAKYWITYIDLIQLHQMFSRATRTNDLDLFTYCLQDMCCLFLSS